MEESSLPPQGSDIRGIKQEIGSKSSSSSLSCLLHNKVPPGHSMDAAPLCLTWPARSHHVSPHPCPHKSVGTGGWLCSGVSELVMLLGSFVLFCNQGGYGQQKAEAAGPAAGKEEQEGGCWGCFAQRKHHICHRSTPTLLPFWDCCDPLGCRISPGAREEAFHAGPACAPWGITTSIPAK